MTYGTKKMWLVIAVLAMSGMGFGCSTQTQTPESTFGTLKTDPVQVFGESSDNAQDARQESVTSVSTTDTPESAIVVEVFDDATLRYTFENVSFNAPKGWMVNDSGNGITLSFADETDGRASVTIRLHDASVDLKKLVESKYPNLERLGWYKPTTRSRSGVQMWEHATYAGIGGGGHTVWYERGYGVEVAFFVNNLSYTILPLDQIVNSLVLTES